MAGFVILFIIADMFFTATNPVGNSWLFPKNDFEKTIAAKGTSKFEKVFYGGSMVVAAYREPLSGSGYVEMGMDYGKTSYLLKMLEQGLITVSGEIVMGMNYFSFLDSLETNPGYIWHKKFYEPYVYFCRDRLKVFFTDALSNILNGKYRLNRYYETEKYRYSGVWTDAELDERIVVHSGRFWGLELSAFEGNFSALEELIDYCARSGIRLRGVWMPYNPYCPVPAIYAQVMDKANSIMDAHGVEHIDMTGAYPREYFHDLGHLNYEVGAVAFTKEIDLWLTS